MYKYKHKIREASASEVSIKTKVLLILTNVDCISLVYIFICFICKITKHDHFVELVKSRLNNSSLTADS